jgi:hypothetical protein
MPADIEIPLAHVLNILDSGEPEAARTAAWLRKRKSVVALQSSRAVPSESLANIYSARARRAQSAFGMKEAAEALHRYTGLVDLLWVNTEAGFAAVFVRSKEPSRIVALFYVHEPAGKTSR